MLRRVRVKEGMGAGVDRLEQKLSVFLSPNKFWRAIKNWMMNRELLQADESEKRDFACKRDRVSRKNRVWGRVLREEKGEKRKRCHLT